MKSKCSVSLDADVMGWLDEARGRLGRSPFLNALLADCLETRQGEEEEP